MSFDPSAFVQAFLTTTTTKTADDWEEVQRLYKTLTSLQYGYFQLMFEVAKNEAIKQAMQSGALDGSIQVVYVNGKLRLFDAAEHQGTPMAVPYKKPGTSTQRDREGNVTAREEWDWDVIWTGILFPIHEELYTWFKQNIIAKMEGPWGFITTHGQDSKTALNTLMQALLDEALTKFGNAADYHGVPFINRARKHGDGREFKKLTKAEKRMAMRHLLLALNQDKLNRRDARKRQETVPVTHAETRIGRTSTATKPVTRRTTVPTLSGQQQFQPTAGQGSSQAILDQITEQLLAQAGYTETATSVQAEPMGLLTMMAASPDELYGDDD